MNKLRVFDGICIDNEETKYPEDCFRVEPQEDGWLLEVAVPDFTRKLIANDPDDIEALERTEQDVFLGTGTPRKNLAFKPGEQRPCIVLKTWITAEGKATFLGWERAIHGGRCTTLSTIKERKAGPMIQSMYAVASEMTQHIEGIATKTGRIDVVMAVNLITGSVIGKHLRDTENDGIFSKHLVVYNHKNEQITLSSLVGANEQNSVEIIKDLPYAQVTSPLRRYQDLHNLRTLLQEPRRKTEDILLVSAMNNMNGRRNEIKRLTEDGTVKTLLKATVLAISLSDIPQDLAKKLSLRVFKDEAFKSYLEKIINDSSELFPDNFLRLRGEIQNIFNKSHVDTPRQEDSEKSETKIIREKVKALKAWESYTKFKKNNPNSYDLLYKTIEHAVESDSLKEEWIQAIHIDIKKNTHYALAELIKATGKIDPENINNSQQKMIDTIEEFKEKTQNPKYYWEIYQKEKNRESSASLGFSAFISASLRNETVPENWIQELEGNTSFSQLIKFAKIHISKIAKSDPEIKTQSHQLLVAALEHWEKEKEKLIKHEQENDDIAGKMQNVEKIVKIDLENLSLSR